jgi:DNA helicase-2/ATP-dependent DNA helicase PcrA
VRQTLVARYPRIFVDEYQDLAPGLHRLVKALCFDYRRQAELFAVGDPDQAIFGWTGTRPELLEQLTEEPGVTTVRLEINYRCGEEIIRLSQRALTVDRKIRGVRAGGKARAQHCPGGYGDQSRTAADLICTAMENGTPLHEIAVLCPTNANCRETANHFRATGIPAYVRGSEYEQTVITSLIETAAAWALFGEHGEDQRLGDVLRQWRWLLDDQADRQIDVAFTEALLRYRDRADAPVVDIIQALTEVGLGLTLDRASRSEEKRALTSMWSALAVGGPLQGMTVANLANRARRTDRVEVTTMSSSKGLEFDLVIMLGADEGRMPFFTTLSRPKELAEERRKFYVSLTRARREIVALYSGFVEWRDGWRRYDGPSRFLRQVGLA